VGSNILQPAGVVGVDVIDGVEVSRREGVVDNPAADVTEDSLLTSG